MMHQKNISTYISTLIISILLLMPCTAFSQSHKVSVVQKDTIPFFRGMAVSADLAGAGMLMFSDYGQYEAALRINLKDTYFPIIELGIGKADHKDDVTKLSYNTSAPYARIGIDFNLMKNRHDAYRLYGGIRYAYTKFKFDLFHPGLGDPVWGGVSEYRADNVSCYYHWLEFVFGVDAKIWGPIRLGWSARYRRRILHDDGTVGNMWYVPGFGKQGSSRMGATFNIIFEI
jgi:hypothetical protein